MVVVLAYNLFLGKPLIFWGGLATYLSLLFTASISLAAKLGWAWVPFEYHPLAGIVTLLFATGHAALGISAYVLGK